MKWIDWKDSFANFLRTQPGRNGVPLSYVIRDNDEPVEKRNAEFLDDYIDQAPLTGPAFASDASEVHTFIVSFITENETAKIKSCRTYPIIIGERTTRPCVTITREWVLQPRR